MKGLFLDGSFSFAVPDDVSGADFMRPVLSAARHGQDRMRQFFPRLSDLSDLSDPSDKVRGSFLFPHEAEPGLNGFIFIRARGPARIPGS